MTNTTAESLLPVPLAKDKEQEQLGQEGDNDSLAKQIIFIRHGRTYMNEYLAKPGTKWGDAYFTDVGLPYDLYRDSPLSSVGVNQARELCAQIGTTKNNNNDSNDQHCLVDSIDLVVVSPLSRTLQTFTYGLMPHLLKKRQTMSTGTSTTVTNNTDMQPESLKIPVVSLPLASERVYLISDLGSPVSELQKQFPFVDFNVGFQYFPPEWWFTVESSSHDNNGDESDIQKQSNGIYDFNSMHHSEYTEWRPHKEGQRYSCLGEPDEQFRQRMVALYEWLDRRPEQKICVIAHWGVLDFLTGIDFENCQMMSVPFTQITNHVKNRHAKSQMNAK